MGTDEKCLNPYTVVSMHVVSNTIVWNGVYLCVQIAVFFSCVRKNAETCIVVSIIIRAGLYFSVA